MSLDYDLRLRVYVGSLDSKGKRVLIPKGSGFEDLICRCAKKFSRSRVEIASVEDSEGCEIEAVDEFENGEKVILIPRASEANGLQRASGEGLQSTSNFQVDKSDLDRKSHLHMLCAAEN